MFNQVQIDLIKKHIGPFLFCFFSLMFILLMQFLIQHVDKLVGKGLPLSIIVELILNNLAYMVVLALPMAVLVSTLMAFGKFSEWNELTAVRAAGVNPIQLMTPILLLGFILFISTAYFSNYILPESNHKARSLFLDIRLQKPGFDLKPGIFYEDLDGYTFLVKDINSETDSLYDVSVFQEPSDEKRRAYIKADRGWLEAPDELTLSLYLIDGTILRYLPGERRGEETLEKSSFNRYRMSFDLSNLAFSRSNPDQKTRTDRTMSAQAMLKAIEEIEEEKKNYRESFKVNTGQEREIPYEAIQEQKVFVRTTEETDTLKLYNSKYNILEIAHNTTIQFNAVNQAINSIDSYRSELESLKSNLEWREFRIAEFSVEVYKKLSIPFACFIFILIGAPIGMLTRKGNIGVAALISSGILTFYFIAIIQGEKLADRLIISPFWGMWGINIFLLVVGIILTLQVSTAFDFSRLWRWK